MDLLRLPDSTIVGRHIPKNSFDKFTNTSQKKLFTDLIKRITWTNKISTETVNLQAGEVQEIQVFKIELKVKTTPDKILTIIDKAVPYHIVFWVEYDSEAYISTATKHPHPTNENIAVIDWTFISEWFLKSEHKYYFRLKESLDVVFKDFCVQITGKPELLQQPIEDILVNERRINQLTKEIARLKSAISKSSQFNKRVELNLQMNKLEKELRELMG